MAEALRIALDQLGINPAETGPDDLTGREYDLYMELEDVLLDRDVQAAHLELAMAEAEEAR